MFLALSALSFFAPSAGALDGDAARNGEGTTSAEVALTGDPAALHKVLIGFTHKPGPPDASFVAKLGGKVKRLYSIVPAIAAVIPEAALPALLGNPAVKVVERDGVVHAIDAELDNTWGVKRIGAGIVHAGPPQNKGTGVKVAVIDTGADYTHPDLSANFDGALPGYDFVNNDADPMDDHGHGTHVSGTVAALDDNVGVVGAAPESRLYALKILDYSGEGNWSDIIAALDWAVLHGVQVTNNSYGDSLYPGTIAQNAFDTSYNMGILHVAAAGNNGNCQGTGDNVTYPARFDSVIAVAATDQSDGSPCFSSTGPAVELAAPGAGIYSTYPLCPTLCYLEMDGTSMASPHVAGTAALVIASGNVTDGNGNGNINDEVRQRLDSTADDLGTEGRDTWFGFGIVNAAHAVAPPLPADVNPPTGSITISSGAAWTKSTSVTLNLTAVDASPPIQMCISNTTTCTAWTALAATKAWTLPTGNGTKRVYAWFRDTWGNRTPIATPYTDTIGLDTTLPVNGAVIAIPGAGKITLSWSGFTDALSGIGGYKVVYATGAAPASCSSGTAIYNGPGTSYTHTGLINQTYYYRVCGIDKAGNMSTGITKSAQPLAVTSNLIVNPGFESGKAPWIFYTNGAGTFQTDVAGPASAKAAHIVITTAGTNVQLYQGNITLQANTKYRLSFKAKSSTGHDLAVRLLKGVSPYTNYGLNIVRNLTTGWANYSVEFITTGFTGTVSDGRLQFWLAPYDAAGDHYYIDDVVLTK